MFGWLSKKRELAPEDRQFALDMMRAAAEGAERSRIVRALGTLGLKVDPASDDEKLCVRAVVEIVRDVAKRAGHSPIWLDDDYRFTAGIVAFTLANALSFRLGVPFEQAAQSAAYILTAVHDDDDRAEEDFRGVDEIAEVYNHLTTKGRIIEAVGTTFTKWLAGPTPENLDRLVALYALLGENVATPNEK
jgi:hypothetical protein